MDGSATILQTAVSQSNSSTSSNSELDKDLAEIDLNGSITNGDPIEGDEENGGTSSNGSVIIINKTNTLKKRLSSSRTPTRKAKRVRFFRNGDKFYGGVVIPVSNERYRSFDSLAEDLTRILEDRVSGAVRNIYSTLGKKITSLDEFDDAQSYVVCVNNESYKKLDYTSSPLGQSNKTTNRLTRSQRPASPLKIGSNGANINGFDKVDLSERDSVVHPRIVTLIRSGTKPRKILRLLLNKRNSPSFEHVLTAITHVTKLDTGCVRKVYTLSGTQLQTLADFFGDEYVFFAYGSERVNADDFRLEVEELKAVQQTRKTLRTGSARSGPKPQMPIKNSVNLHDTTFECDDDTELVSSTQCDDSNPLGLPEIIQNNYTLGPVIGDGNFAVVLKIKRKSDKKNFALKIIDKSKCKGKEHYIDAEIRVMKKLKHEQVMSLHLNFDTPANMFLILEYVSGGDLFDAITRVTRFSESEARLMIRHLASAMAYLHSLSIVHRDIKPENLLVELDEAGHITQLKLADFGLACEVTEPLTAVCGTPTYVAPEILMETGYGLKIDVWAAGIILYILLCGFPPFVSPDNEQEPLFDAILSGVYEFPEPYWNDIGQEVRDCIANMLQLDPDLRFSSEDVLDHPWTLNTISTNKLDELIDLS
ncbi:serine/threonine-protein kinase GL21140 isoform X2 [Contarinia nasturtii]|nr:serine/threonine-protein kinase GL21140 isoform X2 [Contarinia nasturtii]XP_031618713.1 serine/threonine-protein kinase GL21140 isoform X2 [Contarinia nasturtii]XP_031618714.1 serine/threonine-protein kinase GL21140 isoform X2 [Contarinia nasturtii]